jgi:aminoglycoside phosphotransferase family enzyme
VVALLEKVQALAMSAIETIETHMSWVFLTEHHVYKLKKPVRYDYLDFSTLEKRRIDCEAEVLLNRRLAGDVYLGTLPLTLDRKGRSSGAGPMGGTGAIEIDGAGEVVDWLVWMRRLPDHATLDLAIARGQATARTVRAAAELLACFYRDAPSVFIDASDRIYTWLIENLRDLASLSIDEARLALSIVPLLRWLERRPRRLEERRIVEGHGDLRPEHIFLIDPPAVIDCIEFNRSFRELDPLSDLGFLALECERLRAAPIGSTFLEVHRSLAKDDASRELVDFYLALHAGTRAKIALWHLREPDHRDPAIWRRKARDYLELAASHAAHLEPRGHR